MIKKIITFALNFALIIGMILHIPTAPVSAAENMIGNQSQNEGIFAVPTPGEVVIDGKFDDWDWSGRILTFGDYERIDIESAESAYMYDNEYLYIGFKFTDLSPLNNPINPEVEPNWTWRGDCNQFRIVTDDVPIWVTVAYYEPTKVSSVYVDYWGSELSSNNGSSVAYLTERGGTKLDKMILGSKTPKNIVTTGEIAFIKNEDEKGYCYELKIPWKMLYNDTRKVVPGAVFRFGIECKFTDDSGTANFANTAYDNHQPGDTTSSFFYSATDAWGDMTLSNKGNIETRQYSADIENENMGSIHLRTKVPKNSKYITVVADDTDGNRIANIASELAISEKNIIAEDENSYTVDITWDGKGLYGDYVNPGKYIISGITHEGLKVYFDYVAYNPGTPAWVISDDTGSFGSDHYPPEAVASYGKETFIGYASAESGYGLISIGEDGKKKWGIKRGGRFLAATEKYVYSVPGSDFYASNSTTGDVYILRLDRETGTILPFILNGEARKTELAISTIFGINQSVMPKTMGMAAYENTVAIATASNNTDRSVVAGKLKDYVSGVSLIDGETALLKSKIYVPDIGQITYSKDGELYAVSGKNSIVLVNTRKGSYEVLPIKNVENSEFTAITCDDDGNVLVFDKGEDRQIKAFNPDSGALVYTVGKQGGRALVGNFDNTGFTHAVTSISVDGYNRIWVAELWEYPRRVSVWNTDGTVFKDYIGTAGYMSAGAVLHDTDPDKFYIGANELEIDHESKSWELKKILWVPDISKGQAYPMKPTNNTLMQHFSTEINGKEKEFIFGKSNSATVLYSEKSDGTFAPVFAVGLVGDLNISRSSTGHTSYYDTSIIESEVTNLVRAGYDAFRGIDDETFYMWNDTDGDACIDYDECEFIYGYSYNDNTGTHSSVFPTRSGWGNRMTSDMRFVLSGTDNECYMFTPEYYTEDGVPRYSLKSIKYLTGASVYNSEAVLLEGTNKVLTVRTDGGKSREAEQNGIKVIDYDLNSESQWWYNNEYPGVHGSHTAPVPNAGEVIGPIKTLGIINVEGEEIFALRGNLGSDFFMTTDGYYIQTVLKDARKGYISLPKQEMDMTDFDMTESSEIGEPFSGSLSYHNDGVVRMSVSTGGPAAVVTKIEGLEKINRIDGYEFVLTSDEVENAKIYNKQMENQKNSVEIGNSSAAKSGITVNKVITEDITIDGSIDEWGKLDGIKLSKSGVYENGEAKLAYDDENLYGMFMISDKSPMANAGGDFTQLFKTGDAIDICISPNGSTSEAGMGDMRIVISNYMGNPSAVMMKKMDYNDTNSFEYVSPVKAVKFDNVSIIRSADVKYSIADKEAYIVEFKIPFDAIGYKPESGDVIRGDIGFITSDEGGTYNTARIYYFNQETGLVKDLPNEADLFPQRWGSVEFK